MSARDNQDNTPASSSGTSTPALASSWSVPVTVSHAVSGLLRRFSTESSRSKTENQHRSSFSASQENGVEGVYTPPYRTASPYQPPPLYPVKLKGYKPDVLEPSALLLTRTLAEEIRLLVPPRLQLCDEWRLVYSLEGDGVSLGTLYKNCFEYHGLRNGFVLVVRDREGGLFGAYLTEAPHPSPHYFGTGECFLWRASILTSNNLSHLPPPPSTDTAHLQRYSTLGSTPSPSRSSFPLSPTSNPNPNPSNGSLAPPTPSTPAFPSGISTPERIRFKAFPYSGVNDYLMLCDAHFFSIGGGDGRYGLWLDDTFEKGVSDHCLTFGNEPLSEEGGKFGILGVEVWSIGN